MRLFSIILCCAVQAVLGYDGPPPLTEVDGRSPIRMGGEMLGGYRSYYVHRGEKMGGGQQTIVLELFGGLTSSHGMQLTRGGRALMILAGPMMTLLLGIISLGLTWNIVAPVMTSYNLNFWDLAISPFTAALISPKLYILSCLIMIGEWWTILNLLPIYPLDGGQLIAQYIRSPRKVFMTGFITAILIGLLSFQLFHGYFIPIFMALFAYSNYREYKNAPF